MLDTAIHWFTIGMGLVAGLIAAVIGLWLIVMLLAFIFVVVTDFIYDLSKKQGK